MTKNIVSIPLEEYKELLLKDRPSDNDKLLLNKIIMNLEDKTKDELIILIKDLSEKFKYYKSEWENVTRLCVTKNRELTALKKENTKLKKEMERK